ncbi:MAG: rRNA adenine N-6-methyltransferase family protein [Nitrososphaerales archaeon]
MKKRRRLGQHLLVDTNVLNVILDTVDLRRNEIVYEIGTGNGMLTAELCKRAGKVISCEIDKTMVPSKDLGKYDNLTLLHGDGFTFDFSFDVFVSNLPYSKSRKAIEWLAKKKFNRAVIMVQKEFTTKMLSEHGRSYRAISALAQYCFYIDIIMNVGRNSFRPRPEVDSTLLRLMPKNRVNDGLIKSLKLLFSYRGKKLRAITRKFKIDTNIDKRVEQLTPTEAVGLATIIEQHILQTVR